jgi:3-deoxy-D-manno-octulosonate 8-phosphate phosphatase (KDO 8-P phosphatase)
MTLNQLPYHALPDAIKLKAESIKLLILDVDGVLTDGRLFFDQQGTEYKSFHARDGHGIKLLQQTGVTIAVISGRQSQSVAIRMKMLGIEHVYQGFEDKRAAFVELLAKTGADAQQTAYVGDDLLDLPIMLKVGFAIAVHDANFAVKAKADWCTSLPGGLGAVREVCDLIMYAQNNFDTVLESFLI